MIGQCGERIVLDGSEIHVTVYCVYNKRECRITSVKLDSTTDIRGITHEKNSEILQELPLTLIKNLEELMFGHAND
jgi:hypothetical protein